MKGGLHASHPSRQILLPKKKQSIQIQNKKRFARKYLTMIIMRAFPQIIKR
jgi:hypothetical protein